MPPNMSANSGAFRDESYGPFNFCREGKPQPVDLAFIELSRFTKLGASFVMKFRLGHFRE